MKQEIEQAVDRILEQDMDAVDFGEGPPSPEPGTAGPIDFAVKNCTVRDDEQSRQWDEREDTIQREGHDAWKALYTPPLSDDEFAEYERLLEGDDIDCDAVLALLLPHVQHRELYDTDFEAWNAWMITSQYGA